MTLRRGTAYALAPLLGVLIAGLLGVVMANRSSGTWRDTPADIAVYVSAGKVVHRGGNPYSGDAVWSVEHRVLGLGVKPPAINLGRVAEPPILVWAMQLLDSAPFSAMAVITEIVALLCVTGGLLALLRTSEWNSPLVALLVGLLLPPVFEYVNYANVGVIIFASLAIGLALSRRYPVLAGVVLSVTLCKPQVALPLAGLVILFHSASRRRTMTGFAIGITWLLAASAAVMGPQSLVWWVRSFGSFAGTLTRQPQIPSLVGLYLGHVPAHVALLLTVGGLLLAAMATAFTYWRMRDASPVSIRSLAWLWLLWFLVAPYGHYYDYLFLAPVLLACFHTPARAERVRAIVLVYGIVLLGLPPHTYPGEAVIYHLAPIAAVLWLLPVRVMSLRGKTDAHFVRLESSGFGD